MDEEVADLRTITVRDDNIVLICELSDFLADGASDFLLSFSGGFAVFLEGVATESEDNSFLFHIVIIITQVFYDIIGAWINYRMMGR